MAIEALKKITIVSPKDTNRRLIKTINRLGMMEVNDAKDLFDEHTPFKNFDASMEDADEALRKIDFILNLTHIFYPEQESFIKGLTPLPLVTTQKEIDAVLNGYDLEERYQYAYELDEAYRNAERIIGEIENEVKELEPIRDLPFDLADFFSPVHVSLVVGYVPRKNLALIDPAYETWEKAAWEEIEQETIPVDARPDVTPSPATVPAEKTRMVFAFLKDDAEEVRHALASVEFDEIQLPGHREKISDRISELKEDLERYREKIAGIAEKVRPLVVGRKTGEDRRALLVLKAYWTNIRNEYIASSKGVHGKWVHILKGYIRAKDADVFTGTINREFPESMVTMEDPAQEDDVPVSISLPRLLRPIQLLTEMFGLPYYRGFDPTPFMQLNFYIFFGVCFSDVGYGLMLTVMGAYLNTKTRIYGGVNNLSRMLFYGGISSMVFGALMGSWFGDLYKPEYLGQGNILSVLQQKFVVIDPMEKTVVALLAALGIGVLNQFLGIILRMYSAIRNRDIMGAFSDGVCWIATLTGLLMMVGKVFGDIPPKIFNTGLWLFIAGALGLILTQGRDIKSPFGRIMGGLVSLYGIMGSYGITAFIGDILSYCRLLALGLTTSIVAMAFNLMAGMLRDVPYVGMFLFIIILLIGHLFNFLISALGAFVHSMRLLFVEFFGRFYEGGARPFQPLGFDSPMFVMKKTGE
ncbi:MAG: V-type ATP synthase subunit I [Syntrophorhabdus sp. PtaU1.Bin058]|nr:MAG: V-type ATP synthase subunit I [Syntrophorhabdus sp. PtaU1.Bin058]